MFIKERRQNLKEQTEILEKLFNEFYKDASDTLPIIEKSFKRLYDVIDSNDFQNKKRKQEDQALKYYLYVGVDKNLKHLQLLNVWNQEINENFLFGHDKWKNQKTNEFSYIIDADTILYLSSNYNFEVFISIGQNLENLFLDFEIFEFLKTSDDKFLYIFSEKTSLLPRKFKIIVKSGTIIVTTSEILSETFFVINKKDYYKIKSFKEFYDNLGQLWILDSC